jgi:hypothetical protein
MERSHALPRLRNSGIHDYQHALQQTHMPPRSSRRNLRFAGEGADASERNRTMAPDLLDHFGEDLVLVHLGRSEERLGERVLHNTHIEPSNRQHATDNT